MNRLPETRELYSSHIPALKTLVTLGWDFLSQKDCLIKRGSVHDVILRDELIDSLKGRRFEYKGEWHPLSLNAIDQIVRELSSVGLNEGLLAASKKLYEKISLGITVTEFIKGKKHNPTIPIIDWVTGENGNNSFLVTEEMEVLSSAGTHTRRPDIVCFVNGLPLVVIEAKRPNSGNPNKNMVNEGISQNIRNQKTDEIPQLFAYAQLLLSISGTDGRYGTTRTMDKFWALWREEEYTESHFSRIKNAPLTSEQFNAIFADKPANVRSYFSELWSAEQLPDGQDRLLIGLLTPTRFLEFVRYFIFYDDKVGKIAARYPQVFAIKALVERINQRTASGGRKGGVLWHTTGSGKSFTMVLLCKALLLHPSLKDSRILVVTDRTDLEKQLVGTFRSGGAYGSAIATKKEGEKSRARSGKELAKRIGQGTERIIFTIINKFNTASRQAECYNPSDKLIVLVDEGHRSQGGENHERMRKSLPNAAYIAFTGTPLLKKDKTTNKFGSIIHAYTMQRAAEDGTVTPLLYEERPPLLETNQKAIDTWFDKISAGLSDQQKVDLKKKYATRGAVQKSDNRIELIAWDIAVHFNENFKKLNLGLKGQIACDSKLSAIRYKQHLDATELVTSAVIISAPDTREGHKDVDESKLPEIQQWWKDNVGSDTEGYERRSIDNFASEGAPDLLIVVDKLLTGFDEPRNAVLYIDKPLKEHNLIQAIARVNRLHEQKKYGLLIDYRGILEELDTAIEKFQDLASRTQGGYDINDIDGLYDQMSNEYARLPALHKQLWALFPKVTNRLDREQFRQVLIPDYGVDSDGNSYDKRQKVREDFYEALTEFGLCLKLALSSRSFFEDSRFSDDLIDTYKKELAWFTSVRQIAKQDAQETVDYSSYEEQIRRLVDKQVIGIDIKEPKGAYVVNLLGKKPEEWSEEKVRNETDLIKTRMKKTIEQDLISDPYAQKTFAALLQNAIEEAEALFDHPIKQYALFKEFEKKVESGIVEGMPEEISNNRHARAYYGVFKLVLGNEAIATLSEENHRAIVEESLAIEIIVDKAVAEHSLNTQDIEASIRKNLLPGLFKLAGMEKANRIIDEVIRITRIGIERSRYKSKGA